MTGHQFKIEWAGTVNHNAGRGGRKPIALVNHITAGRFPGCLTWMQNPAAKASSNYLVTKTGRILQLVRDEDTAWANGGVNRPSWKLYDGSNPNRYTLSIEHEAMSGEALTEIQYQATLWLHRQLLQKHGIPADREHIIGHYQIDSVNRPNCPGPQFPWDRLMADLAGVQVQFNGRRTGIPARLVDGRTQVQLDGYWVQLRSVIEMVPGATIDWDAASRTVDIIIPAREG